MSYRTGDGSPSPRRKPPKSGGSGSGKGSGTGAGTGSGSSSSTPPSIADYLAAIQNDPIYQQTLSGINAQGVADAGGLGNGILQALVGRGIAPDAASIASKLGLGSDVANWIASHVDLGMASKLANDANTSGVSEQSHLDLAHNTAMQNIKDALAARGMLQSGATPFMTGREEDNYKNNVYQADKALSDYINGAYQAFLGREQGRQGSASTALEDAYNRLVALYGDSLPPGAGGTGSGSGSGAPGPTGPTYTDPSTQALPTPIHPGPQEEPGGPATGFVRTPPHLPSMIVHAPRIRASITHRGLGPIGAHIGNPNFNS